jgi:hypothetical protein
VIFVGLKIPQRYRYGLQCPGYGYCYVKTVPPSATTVREWPAASLAGIIKHRAIMAARLPMRPKRKLIVGMLPKAMALGIERG